MKLLKIAMMFSLISASFAKEEVEVKILTNIKQYDSVIKKIDEEVGRESTCLDDYLKREKKLKKVLIYTPPLTIVATPVTFYGGLLSGAALAGALGATGWDVLGAIILGGYGAGLATVGYGVYIETSRGIEFGRNRSVINSLIAANSQNYENKSFKKLRKKFLKKYPYQNLSKDEFAKKLLWLDQTGALCDGSLRKYDGDKLRKKLAKNKDIIKALR